MSQIRELIHFLERNEKPVYIQPHDFPDPDGVASAFGLQALLAKFNIESYIVHEGLIDRDSLLRMIREFSIDIRPASDFELTEDDQIIIVDGCKGNKNVTDLPGEEIAVVDHHETANPENVRFVDIREEYGACATLIYTYFREMNVIPITPVASALMVGINIDTALLTRGTALVDVEAYHHLYPNANVELVNSILLNNIELSDLKNYHYLIQNQIIEEDTAFCFLPDGCNQNQLGILADFVLSVKEINFVALAALNDTIINLSIRSEKDEWDASSIIRRLIQGIGFGGGHRHMAGGVIPDASRFEADDFHRRLKELLFSKGD